RLRRGRWPGLEPPDGGSFEDPHAALEEHSPQAAREPSRLHSGRVQRVDAAPEEWRATPLRHLRRRKLHVLFADAEAFRGLHGLAPAALLRGGARHAEIASSPIPDVDVVLLRPGGDLVDALDRGSADLERAVGAVLL